MPQENRKHRVLRQGPARPTGLVAPKKIVELVHVNELRAPHDPVVVKLEFYLFALERRRRHVDVERGF